MFFYAGIRVSTIIMGVILLTIPLARRDWRGLLAAPAFFFGFETLYQGVYIPFALLSHLSARADPGWLAAGVGWVLAAHFAGLKMSRPWIVITILLFVVWSLTGFHSNPDNGPIYSWTNEFINVAAKTAFGMIYLVPLLRTPTKLPTTL